MSRFSPYLPPAPAASTSVPNAPRDQPLGELPRTPARRPDNNAYVPPAPQTDQGPDLAAVQAAALAELERERTQLESQTAALAATTQTFAESIAKLDAAVASAREVLAQDAVAIGLLVAKQLVTHLAAADGKAVTELVLGALKEVPDDEGVVVRVSVDDLPRVELVLAGSKRAAIDVVGDATLAAGDCIVQSDGLVIDARLQHRLDGIGEVLRAKIPDDERLATHDEVSLEDPSGERGHPPTAATGAAPERSPDGPFDAGPALGPDAGPDSGPDGISLGDIDEVDEC